MTTSEAAAEPADFRAAVESLHAAQIRPEIEVGSIRPPQRLAPYSYALGAEVTPTDAPEDDPAGSAFGRLVLLYDPDGQEAWDGALRLVAYIQAELEPDLAMDPLLPEVAWSWLTEALEATGPQTTALGGTVTATSSVRYGDIAGPPRAHQLELRASWTALSPELAAHLEAFCSVLSLAAGLPPVGVASLGRG